MDGRHSLSEMSDCWCGVKPSEHLAYKNQGSNASNVFEFVDLQHVTLGFVLLALLCAPPQGAEMSLIMMCCADSM